MAGVEAGLGAFLAALLASPLALAMLRGRVVDVPNQRSSHATPTPRGGGIVLIVGVAAGLLVSGARDTAVIVAFSTAALLGGIGLVEDVQGLRVTVRLSLQTAAGLIAVFWLIASPDHPIVPLILGIALALFWMVGFTNAFNFMDGINGIGAAQLIVAGVAWTVAGGLTGQTTLSTLGVVTVGSALGFLPWNFPRARFFMGDVGSYFSGGWLAFAVLVGITLGVPVAAMIAPLLIFGADTTYTLLSRVLRGEAWSEPHRSHVYQRLVVGGWSHARTTAFYVVLAVGTTLGGMLWLAGTLGSAIVGTCLAGGVLLAYLVSPWLVSRRTAEQQ